jgi:radical SAM superfamily enzyme YgiQ (UPF0313 family)
MDAKLNVVLVNLISEEFLTRFQAPLAVNVLAAYFRAKCSKIPIKVLDMQHIFESTCTDNQTVQVDFSQCVKIVIAEIVESCLNSRAVIGLSIKWTTQDIARAIIEKVNDQCVSARPLFVVGNIGVTHGFQELLQKKPFDNVLAVIGEGEEALVSIAQQAGQHTEDMNNLGLYKDIANVAINLSGKINIAPLKRIDLQAYPETAMIKPVEIYDKEWDVHALETSRGCPWGKCTFCSVKKQFGDSQSKDCWHWRSFPLSKILFDIRNYALQGVRNFDIKDSEFFGPMRYTEEFNQNILRVEEFAKGLIAINEELRTAEDVPNKTISVTHVSARVDTIYSSDPEEAEKNKKRKNAYILLKSAGLRRVYLGIESGSPSQLRRYCKGVTVEENKRAIEILRELGLEIEVGFIFFDYLASLAELQQNIDFIEQTGIHETDSRILGSLRIQKGSPYVEMAKLAGLLLDEDHGQLSYIARFRNPEVESIERIFSKWESATRKLAKILPSYLRIASYKMDFYFVKDVMRCFITSNQASLPDKIKKHVAKRKEFLKQIRHEAAAGQFGKNMPKLLWESLNLAEIGNKGLIEEISLCGATEKEDPAERRRSDERQSNCL